MEKPLRDVAQHTPATENAVEEITRKIDTATDAVADTLISDLVPKVAATYGATKRGRSVWRMTSAPMSKGR